MVVLSLVGFSGFGLVSFFFRLDLLVSNIEQPLPQSSYFIAQNFAVKIFRPLH